MPLENEKTKVIAALVEDKPGVLHSVSNLFRRRAFNIGSLTVGPAETKGLSRMTISVKGDEKTIDQVVLQLNKLVEVVKVCKLDPDNIVTRELALAKVKVPDTKTTIRRHKLCRRIQSACGGRFSRKLNRRNNWRPRQNRCLSKPNETLRNNRTCKNRFDSPFTREQRNRNRRIETVKPQKPSLKTQTGKRNLP